MHPFLIKMGVRPEVVDFFSPFFTTDEDKNLCFAYGSQTERYGMAFHHIPSSEILWIAGEINFSAVRQVFISATALDAIAWLHLNYSAFSTTDNILFLSTGLLPNAQQFSWISKNLSLKDICLIFGNDIFGKISDLIMAAGICNIPIAIYLEEDKLNVQYRFKSFSFPIDNFSLNAFERKSGSYLRVKTDKPKYHNSWLEVLSAPAFNNY